jgi:hypothetical protein
MSQTCQQETLHCSKQENLFNHLVGALLEG